MKSDFQIVSDCQIRHKNGKTQLSNILNLLMNTVQIFSIYALGWQSTLCYLQIYIKC